MTGTLARPTGIGTPVARVDAVAKVTGQARYSAEYPLARLGYGWVVPARIARGSVVAVERESIADYPGVIAVFDHTNAERLNDTGDNELRLLQSEEVHYRGQVVALVVAETLEQARAAAEAISVLYDVADHDVQFRSDHPDVYVPDHVNPNSAAVTDQGDVDSAFAAGPIRIDEEYRTPAEHNNPMEPHAATADWSGGQLTVFDSNQGAFSVRSTLAELFGLAPESVRVRSDYVGGGFGSKGSARPPVVLASLASRALDRPVRVSLSRQQMFFLTGYRTPTIQRVRLAADTSGRLTALEHQAWSQTSRIVEFAEQTAVISRMMYDVANLRTEHRLLQLDVPTPKWMRAPGEAPGSFALESAMDELAEACQLDPVALRLRNEPAVDPENGRPFSSRNLVACLSEGARRFGWAGRDPRPGIRSEDGWLVGTGMACSTYPARNAPASCTIEARPDATYEVRITAVDIGTGARTALLQIAADALAVPLAQVRLQIADSDFGPAMIAGGSMGTASWSWAIIKAAQALLARTGGVTPTAPVSVRADTSDDIKAQAEVSRHAFGAQFVEVRVQPGTGEIRVPRMVGVFAAGRIVNPVTARSQFLGGMTFGLSMALHEESIMDLEFGDFANHDLAGYHFATNADVGEIEVGWVEEQDEQTNPAGIKGIGEIGIVGTAAAIANAVWHATGVRQRQLPIRPDRVLAAGQVSQT